MRESARHGHNRSCADVGTPLSENAGTTAFNSGNPVDRPLLGRGELVTFGTIHDRIPGPNPVVSWHSSSAAPQKVEQARVSAVSAGCMQARHLRGFCEKAVCGRNYSRPAVVTYYVSGRCDIRARSDVINTRFHRHDTYRSWKAAKHILRRASRDPPWT